MSSSNHVVRAKSFWKGRAALCAIAFVVTGLAVHRLAEDGFERTKVNPSARAIVYHAFAPDTDARFARPTTAEIKRQVLSDGSLQRASAQGSGHPSGYLLDTIGHAQQKLRVVVSEDVGRDRFKISITARDSDVAQAVRLANALAEQYADDHDADFRATVEARHVRARNLAQQAKRELIAKRNRLDEFLRVQFEDHLTQPGRPAVAYHPPDVAAAAPSPRVADQFAGEARLSNRTIENPAWTDLNQQLLRQRKMRFDLLQGTVQTHPRIRSLDDRIAELEQRLAITPRKIPELAVVRPLPDIDAAVEDARSTREPTTSQAGAAGRLARRQWAATLREYSSCQEAVRLAAGEYDRLVMLERRQWERKALLPGVQVHPAEMPEEVARAAHAGSSPRAVLLALASALAMAAGVAMISSGMESDPALCNAQEVESMLPAPLLGGIPSKSPFASRPPTRAASGMTLLFYGMVLVMVCFGVLLALFGPGL